MVGSALKRKLREKGAPAVEVYFRDPLLSLGYSGMLTARVVINAWVVVHVAGTVVLLLSDISWVFWLGALNALYLLDRLLHYGDAERRLPDEGEEAGNLAAYLTPRARRAVTIAYTKASLTKGGFYLNLAAVLLEAASVAQMLARLEVERQEFETKLETYLRKETVAYREKERLRAEAESVTLRAYLNREKGQKYINVPDLFAALGSIENEQLASLFKLFDIDADALRRAAVFGRLSRAMRLPGGVAARVLERTPFRPRHRIMNRAWTARPTSLLDTFSTDLTDLARRKRIGFMVGHGEPYRRLVDILSRSAKPNALLIGESGVGKRTIVEYLARKIADDDVPRELFDKRLVMLDVGGLVAGADQGEVQGRIREIFNEIYKAGNVILFIPNIHSLSRTSHPGAMSPASNVLPLIASQGVPTIGATMPREYRQLIEPDSLFGEAFEMVRVEEVGLDETIRILASTVLSLEAKHRVTVAYRAIKAAAELAQKYFHDKPLPSSAEDLLRETISYVVNKGENVVTSDDVIAVAEERVNVPIHEVGQGEAEQLLNLEALIHRRLVGQDEAVRAVSRALRAYRSGLAPGDGPIGTFLFVGPTGVGKTELAKTLAEIQFGSEEAMTRFDMSEYQDTESIHRLIGSPDGSVSGALTEAVRIRPYSLILLDEFEKAHRDILELFLQVFDDGRLTDNLGRTVSFKNTIIIATSNAEAPFVMESLRTGRGMAEVTEELRSRLVRHFSPELLNRFSAVVIFKSLTRQEIEAIAKRHLEMLARQLKEAHDITLSVDEGLVTAMAKLGYDPAFGARPLERTISDMVRAPLSEKILSGEVGRGMHISIRIQDGLLYVYEAA